MAPGRRRGLSQVVPSVAIFHGPVSGYTLDDLKIFKKPNNYWYDLKRKRKNKVEVIH
jgi:hypothetical protein